MKSERRGSWYLLTGVVLGVAMGLIYSWVISPVKYIDAPPYALRADYKEEYRALVAAAYMYSSDLVRAQDRLVQLKDDSPAQSVAMQAQRALAEGHPAAEVQALSNLATALSRGIKPTASSPVATPQSTSTPEDGSASLLPVLNAPVDSQHVEQASSTPQDNLQAPGPGDPLEPSPTAASSPATAAPFMLQDSTLVCNMDQTNPLLQVEVVDSAGQPVPGVELVVTWKHGQDHFFTGLQPELGLGYGDFLMTPDTAYTVRLAIGGQEVDDLTASQCMAEDGSQYWGSWMLTFIQP